MCRNGLLILVIVLAWCGRQVVWGDDRDSLRSALGLQEALRNAVEQAEPSIACILVSRSDGYRKAYDDVPPADNPGQLGGFNPNLPTRVALPERELQRLHLADPNNVPEAYGSGVVIGEEGLVLTNYHVVREATKVYVRLPGGKGCYADIHAADPRSDLAVLRLLDERLRPFRAIKLGDGDKVKKMDFVVSLANPFAAGFPDGSPSASWGIISNLRRRAPAGSLREEERTRTLHHYGTLLQTDARLNFGCSGGALLNLQGELIGLTTALAAITGSETAGGFAVPLTERMRAIVEKLAAGEEVEYGFLGVQPYPTVRRGEGVTIQRPTEGSPAYHAGLRAEDQILAINGVPVQDTEDLFLAVGTLLAGSEARIAVRSPDRRTKTLNVTLAKFFVAGPGKIIVSKKSPAVRGLRVEYTSVLMMRNYAVGSQAQYHDILPGVWVREVQPGSPAATSQLHVDDVVTHVNGQPVNTPAEFYREARKVAPAKPLELTLASADGVRSPTQVIIR
jgi:S1-C subfamily serine protease